MGMKLADRPGLKCLGDINRLSQAVIRALRSELDRNHMTPIKGDVTVCDAILAKIPQLRDISSLHMDALAKFKRSQPHLEFPALHKELFSVDSWIAPTCDMTRSVVPALPSGQGTRSASRTLFGESDRPGRERNNRRSRGIGHRKLTTLTKKNPRANSDTKDLDDEEQDDDKNAVGGSIAPTICLVVKRSDAIALPTLKIIEQRQRANHVNRLCYVIVFVTCPTLRISGSEICADKTSIFKTIYVCVYWARVLGEANTNVDWCLKFVFDIIFSENEIIRNNLIQFDVAWRDKL